MPLTPSECPFEATRAAYADPAGAAAYALRESAWRDARDRSVWRLLDGIRLEGALVLDLGCGTGGDVAEMRRRGAAAWGLDASPALLAEARRLHGNPDWWLLGDMLAPGVPAPAAGGLDLAWSQASLVHVPRGATRAALALWASWLRPGGRIVLATKEGDGQAVSRVLGDGFPRTMVYRRLDEVLAELSALGLRVEAAEGGIPGVGTEETFLSVTASLR